ncbi:hypothetical protein HYDPIDRAFT_166063 [Hydnomerulius pinastri MD-312]|nr:hypothetical protein HYDPIDRAFT_166063 [Hydnomerulius pinastri MD-312]
MYHFSDKKRRSASGYEAECYSLLPSHLKIDSSRTHANRNVSGFQTFPPSRNAATGYYHAEGSSGLPTSPYSQRFVTHFPPPAPPSPTYQLPNSFNEYSAQHAAPNFAEFDWTTHVTGPPVPMPAPGSATLTPHEGRIGLPDYFSSHRPLVDKNASFTGSSVHLLPSDATGGLLTNTICLGGVRSGEDCTYPLTRTYEETNSLPSLDQWFPRVSGSPSFQAGPSVQHVVSQLSHQHQTLRHCPDTSLSSHIHDSSLSSLVVDRRLNNIYHATPPFPRGIETRLDFPGNTGHIAQHTASANQEHAAVYSPQSYLPKPPLCGWMDGLVLCHIPITDNSHELRSHLKIHHRVKVTGKRGIRTSNAKISYDTSKLVT